MYNVVIVCIFRTVSYTPMNGNSHPDIKTGDSQCLNTHLQVILTMFSLHFLMQNLSLNMLQTLSKWRGFIWDSDSDRKVRKFDNSKIYVRIPWCGWRFTLIGVLFIVNSCSLLSCYKQSFPVRQNSLE